MAIKRKPQDFVSCNFSDQAYLDEDGFLVDCLNTDFAKYFSKYKMLYYFRNGKTTLPLYFWEDEFRMVGSIEYYLNDRTIFRVPKEPGISLSREDFMDRFMQQDKDLANWMLWNL